MACLHDHSCEDHNCAADWSLFNHIDIPKVVALNESVPGSVKSVFKPWEQRLDTSGLQYVSGHHRLLYYCSNACVLLQRSPLIVMFSIGFVTDKVSRNRFTSDVKIKSISVVGGPEGTSPSRMRAFINREGIDFSDAQNMQPVQEWELAENLQGVLEYQTSDSQGHCKDAHIGKHHPFEDENVARDHISVTVGIYSRFQGVANLTLHFSDNFGGDTTKIYYIGLRGEATQNKRDVVATIVYEVMPNPSEHKTQSDAGGGFSHVE
ncbi:hypothetical protein ACP70R_037674 [Stipagrostis hirtigluma subsp. patula]